MASSPLLLGFSGMAVWGVRTLHRAEHLCNTLSLSLSDLCPIATSTSVLPNLLAGKLEGLFLIQAPSLCVPTNSLLQKESGLMDKR